MADTIDLPESSTLSLMLGANDHTLETLRKELQLKIEHRGNSIFFDGKTEDIAMAKTVIGKLYNIAEAGQSVGDKDIYMVIKDMQAFQEDKSITDTKSQHTMHIGRNKVSPVGRNQLSYVKALKNNKLVFCSGPAGTGKTFLGVVYGLSLLEKGEVKKIVITRPVIEAGENLGFLPGDLKEKIDPYLRPIYDIIEEMLGKEKRKLYVDKGIIEVAPLAYMRGRTLTNCFSLLDEAQNASALQMKMFLTRFGEGCKMVVVGDPTQSDLPKAYVKKGKEGGYLNNCGLTDATKRLSNLEDCEIIELTVKDVMRDSLTAKIVERYNDKFY